MRDNDVRQLDSNSLWSAVMMHFWLTTPDIDQDVSMNIYAILQDSIINKLRGHIKHKQNKLKPFVNISEKTKKKLKHLGGYPTAPDLDSQDVTLHYSYWHLHHWYKYYSLSPIYIAILHCHIRDVVYVNSWHAKVSLYLQSIKATELLSRCDECWTVK